MTRRTQNRQENIDSREGAGQPVEFQAVNVEYHGQRNARQPVGARAKPLPRRLKLRPAACCRIQSKASTEVREPQPLQLASILNLCGIRRQPKSHGRPQ